jgi:hypothetical protein
MFTKRKTNAVNQSPYQGWSKYSKASYLSCLLSQVSPKAVNDELRFILQLCASDLSPAYSDALKILLNDDWSRKLAKRTQEHYADYKGIDQYHDNDAKLQNPYLELAEQIQLLPELIDNAKRVSEHRTPTVTCNELHYLEQALENYQTKASHCLVSIIECSNLIASWLAATDKTLPQANAAINLYVSENRVTRLSTQEAQKSLARRHHNATYLAHSNIQIQIKRLTKNAAAFKQELLIKHDMPSEAAEALGQKETLSNIQNSIKQQIDWLLAHAHRSLFIVDPFLATQAEALNLFSSIAPGEKKKRFKPISNVISPDMHTATYSELIVPHANKQFARLVTRWQQDSLISCCCTILAIVNLSKESISLNTTTHPKRATRKNKINIALFQEEYACKAMLQHYETLQRKATIAIQMEEKTLISFGHGIWFDLATQVFQLHHQISAHINYQLVMEFEENTLSATLEETLKNVEKLWEALNAGINTDQLDMMTRRIEELEEKTELTIEEMMEANAYFEKLSHHMPTLSLLNHSEADEIAWPNTHKILAKNTAVKAKLKLPVSSKVEISG